MTKEPGKFGCKKYDKINEHDDDEDWHSDASWSVLKCPEEDSRIVLLF